MDYSNGKIYRLVCNVSGKQYIGSTTQPLSKRKNKHKTDFNHYKKGQFNYITSFMIIEGGNYDIFLIENYPCQSKEQLHARERHFIETTECVNKYIPTRTKQEWTKDNEEKIAEYKKEYYEENKDRLKTIMKENYEKNKDRYNEQQREYYKENKEKLIERIKRNYEKHKEKYNEKRKEKVECECGSTVRKDKLNLHLKTKKHKNYLSSLSLKISSS